MARQLTSTSPVQFLKSVGPVRARALARLGIASVGDLLHHYPRSYFDRTHTTPTADLIPGTAATVVGEVLTCGERRVRAGGSVQSVTVGDASGTVVGVWFNQRFLLKQLRVGTRLIVSGTVERFHGRLQFTHPDFELLTADNLDEHVGRLVPVYPLTQGLGQRWLRNLIRQCLQRVDDLEPEPLPLAVRRRRRLCDRPAALRGIHAPRHADERDAALRRLVYEELFLVQLTMALRRGARQERSGVRLERPGDLTARLVATLPFALTGAQRRVLREILNDMQSGQVMHRLLQGDVGAGKTLVAVIAALFVMEQGYQAVLLAPTELLAAQHGRVVQQLLEPLDIRVGTLTGGLPARQRQEILTGAAAGNYPLLVGTHALLQEGVDLPRLGLSIVDEQHRFGVQQRVRSSRLAGADRQPHVLVMSATPIPRSLSLTLYGDLDLSVIDELPRGRQPIETLVMTDDREDDALEICERYLDRGMQGFIVYPVIEQTAGQDLKAAEIEYARLARGRFRDRRLGLVHGKLRPPEKAAVMQGFAAGEIDLLVATTVVEVGIDVPGANVMIIHHPERFGLAQLHQLRGRIGRGGRRATCVLVCGSLLPAETLERIRFFADHLDGFALAEEDLRRRGPGDVWGVRQHGVPGFRLANPLRDRALVDACRRDVADLLAADPQLISAEGRVVAATLEAKFGRALPDASG